MQDSDNIGAQAFSSFPLADQVGKIVREGLAAHKTGGRFIVAPTGAGKTTAISKEIARQLNAGLDRMIIYVTPTCANRDEMYDEVMKLVDDDKRDLVYRVESIGDTTEGITSDMYIPDSVLDEGLRETYSEICKINENIKVVTGMPVVDQGEMRDYLRSRVDRRLKVYRRFRKQLLRILNARCKEMKAGIPAPEKEKRVTLRDYALRSKEFTFIHEICPECELLDKRVLIMTPEKFFYPMDTIITGVIRFYTQVFLRKHVAAVILDESDGMKESWLKCMVQDAAKRAVDPVFAVGLIHESLQSISDISSTPILGRLFAQPGGEELRREFEENILTEFERLYKRERLDKCYKLDIGEDGYTNRGFLFSSVAGEVLSTSREGYAVMHRVRQNAIIPKSKAVYEQGENRLDIQVTIDSCSEAFERFCLFVGRVAELRLEQRNEGRTSIYDEEVVRATVNSVLTELRIVDPGDQDCRSKLTEIVMSYRMAFRTGRGGAVPEWLQDMLEESFYLSGVSQYRFVDDPEHDSITSLNRYKLFSTPERLLLILAANTRVLLVSATAEADSTLNFPVRFFKTLDGLFDEVPIEDRRELTRLCAEDIAMRKEVYSVSVERTAPRYEEVKGSLSTDAMFDLVKRYISGVDEKTLRGVTKFLTDCGAAHVHLQRYLLVSKAFVEFLRSPDNESALVFLGAFAAEDEKDSAFNKRVLFRILDTLKRSPEVKKGIDPRKERVPVEAMVHSLRSEQWKSGMEAIQASLGKGVPAFVLTAYQTASVGKNIQYIPCEKTLMGSARLPFATRERDFDFLVFDRPTNLLVSKRSERLGPDERSAEMLTMLYQQRALAEECEVSIDQMTSNVSTYTRVNKDGKAQAYGINHLPSVRSWIARFVAQASGRAVRTGIKAPTVKVIMSNDLAASMDPDGLGDVPMTYEMESICEVVRDYQMNGDSTASEGRRYERLENEFQKNDLVSRKRVRKLIHGFRGSEYSKSVYNDMGRIALCHPTGPDSDDLKVCHGCYTRIPIEASWYSYDRSGSGDEGRVTTRFDSIDKDGVSTSCNGQGSLIVSSVTTGLDSMMACPVIRSHFEANGFATEWKPSHMLMTPSFANDIYKGRIGEQAFEAIYNELGRRGNGFPPLVNDLSQEGDLSRFELFDFRIDGTDTYVDAKNWNNGYDKKGRERDRYLEHIFDKMSRIGARKVIVPNIIMPKDLKDSVIQEPLVHDGRTVVVIPGLITAEGVLLTRMLDLLIWHVKN